MVHIREASRKVWCELDNFPLENVSDCTWQVFQVCGNPRNSCSKYETKGENLSLRILSLASINVSKLVETFPNSLLAKKTLRMKPQKQKLCRMTILIKSTSCYDRVTVTLLLQCFFSVYDIILQVWTFLMSYDSSHDDCLSEQAEQEGRKVEKQSEAVMSVLSCE